LDKKFVGIQGITERYSLCYRSKV